MASLQGRENRHKDNDRRSKEYNKPSWYQACGWASYYQAMHEERTIEENDNCQVSKASQEVRTKFLEKPAFERRHGGTTKSDNIERGPMEMVRTTIPLEGDDDRSRWLDKPPTGDNAVTQSLPRQWLASPNIEDDKIWSRIKCDPSSFWSITIYSWDRKSVCRERVCLAV